MDLDQTLKLFDSFWFEDEIVFKNQTSPFHHQSPEISWSSSHKEKSNLSDDDGTTKTGDSEEEEEGEDEEDDDEGNMGGESKERSRKMRLSELELEELKGFMDLGFVFPEEDRDPRLVCLVPALQRLRRRSRSSGGEDDGDRNRTDDSEISGPYLSEAWEALDDETKETKKKTMKSRRKKKKKKKSPLMEWRFSGWNHQMNIKDNLRLWAFTVASTVR